VTRGWYEQAVQHGAQALRERSEHDVELLLLVGGAYRKVGALDRAETALRLALKLAPKSAAVLAGLAELQLEQRDFDGLRATRDRLRLGRVSIDAALADAINLWCGDDATGQPSWASSA
jgi:Flp pilus assembly protein TadD